MHITRSDVSDACATFIVPFRRKHILFIYFSSLGAHISADQLKAKRNLRIKFHTFTVKLKSPKMLHFWMRSNGNKTVFVLPHEKHKFIICKLNRCRTKGHFEIFEIVYIRRLSICVSKKLFGVGKITRWQYSRLTEINTYDKDETASRQYIFEKLITIFYLHWNRIEFYLHYIT